MLQLTATCNIALDVADTSVAYLHPDNYIPYIKLNGGNDVPVCRHPGIALDEIALPYCTYLQLQSPITVCKADHPKSSVETARVTVSAITRNQEVNVVSDELERSLQVLAGTPTGGTRHMTILRGEEIIILTVISDAGVFADSVKFNFIPNKHPGFRINMDRDPNSVPTVADFYRQGVAGYDDIVQDIITHVILPWKVPQEVKEGLNIAHDRGLLLYGRPGTGKTNIARAIGAVLGIHNKVKVINGPSIKSKWVGESESNIRRLFEDAKADAETLDNPPLHILIFDEIDAIAAGRSSSEYTRVDNSILTQLLTCLDGVDKNDNVFVVGITNRKDVLDDAILRSGRLGRHIEVKAPNELQRYYIFRYHIDLTPWTQVSDDDIKRLAAESAGFTGADIADIVGKARRITLKRYVDGQQPIKVTMDDLLASLRIKLNQ